MSRYGKKGKADCHERGKRFFIQGDSGGPLMMQAVKNNKTNVKNGTETVEKVEKKFSRWTLIGGI